jgi:hypothetical protein
MSKQPIAWHREYLENSKRYYVKEKERLERESLALKVSYSPFEDTQEYHDSVAGRAGRDMVEFDCDKFMRGKKT